MQARSLVIPSVRAHPRPVLSLLPVLALCAAVALAVPTLAACGTYHDRYGATYHDTYHDACAPDAVTCDDDQT